jgi:hypothetical protein
VHLVGVRLGDHPAHLVDEVTRAVHEPSAALAQTRVQVPQAVGEERQPVRSGEAGPVDGAVAHEEGDHRAGAVERGTQRRMVVQAQIGREQDDRDVHGGTPELRGGQRRNGRERRR